MALEALLVAHKAAAVLVAAEVQLQPMALCMVAAHQEILVLEVQSVLSGLVTLVHSHQLV